jgi:DNA-binding PadR family transcriptional regulator
MRRKPGVLLPRELSILLAVVQLQDRGQPAYGLAIAREMEKGSEAENLTGYGTLYKALNRMELAGWLTSSWETADETLENGRPRRRLYEITGLGEQAILAAHRDPGMAVLQPGYATS